VSSLRGRGVAIEFATLVNWSEYEFIAEEAADGNRPLVPLLLTGWETIRFEVEDDEEAATSFPLPVPRPRSHP
jgi:hypothetical protein